MRWDDWMKPYRLVMHPLASEATLLAAMSNEDAGVRGWAAVNPQATEQVWLMAARDEDPMVRRGLAEHLAWRVRMHREVPVRVLEVLASDQDERVAQFAKGALYFLGL